MLGYITVRREELKVREFDTYRSFYCGVCRDLKKSCGELSRLTLTYDMTFLAILLTSLYDEKSIRELKACLFHPGQKMPDIRNRYTKYAADMSLLMVYQNLLDDWKDDRSQKSLAASRLLHQAYKKVSAQYPRQVRSLRKYLKDLHSIEEEKSSDLDLAAGKTGEFFRQVFLYDENDIWSRDLGETGFFLGKFIYLMDAYEDTEEDQKSGNYNPFLSYRDRDDYEFFAKEVLTMAAAGAANAFERLPIVDNVEILRNIIYSGIWKKYLDIQSKRKV